MSQPELALSAPIETVDHGLDVLEAGGTGGAEEGRADGLDPGGGGGRTHPAHSLEGGPRVVAVGGGGGGRGGGGGGVAVRGEPGRLHPLQAGSARAEVGVGGGQE